MSELKDKLVLVVDDEARMVNFMRMNLELEGMRVATASNGREALDHVREDMPDVVLLDVMMPVMDGFEALRRIRQLSQVPVLMLTAKDEEEDRVRGLELGADDYIGKPFSHRELVSRIKAVLRRHYQAPPVPQTMVKIAGTESGDRTGSTPSSARSGSRSCAPRTSSRARIKGGRG